MPTIYTITVDNLGPEDAVSLVVEDELPTALDDDTAVWSCVATGSAVCTANGTADIFDVVDIPAGEGLIYLLSVEPQFIEGRSVENTASVISMGSIFDSDTSNNTSVDTDIIALFLDGMEAPEE